MKFKGTKGELEMKFMPGGICIGIGTVGDYCQITANSILPESDEEYAKEKEELEANMQLYASAPELLGALISVSECLNLYAAQLGMHVEGSTMKSDSDDIYGAITALNQSREAIEKALK